MAFRPVAAMQNDKPSRRQVEAMKKSLERSWVVPKLRGRDLRLAIHREWRRPIDADILGMDGHVLLVLHVCSPPIEDTPAYRKKISDIARSLEAWNASGIVKERIKGSASTFECEDEECVLGIPLDVTETRSDEFDL